MPAGHKYDTGKTKHRLVDPVFEELLAKVLTAGAKEYGEYDWQKLDEPIERYTDALMRHLNAFRQGERTDAKSGFPHMAHVAANAMFLEWHSRPGERCVHPDDTATDDCRSQ